MLHAYLICLLSFPNKVKQSKKEYEDMWGVMSILDNFLTRSKPLRKYTNLLSHEKKYLESFFAESMEQELLVRDFS
jgi:hypothetical protein